MVIQSNCNFAKNINAPAISKVFPNSEGDVLALQISGDFTSTEIHIEGRNNAYGDWVSLAGIGLNDLSVVRNGFTKPGIYEIEIVGIRELRANIKSISGGKLSVLGQIISTQEV